MSLWHSASELMNLLFPPLPTVYWLDIIRTCNLRCVMCPQSQGLEALPAKMSMDVFRRIIDEIAEAGPLVKLYLSGEPLLHERLFDMIDGAHAAGCETMIHTNATLLDEDMALRILASPLTFLSFSFDGCSPEVYERLRPPASYGQVRTNIRRFLDLRRQGGHRGPHTAVEIIAMRETEPLLQGFVEEWSLSGVDRVNVAEFLTWHGKVQDRRAGCVPADVQYRPCAAPFRHGCILSDGTVVPCCTDVDRQMPLGNVILAPFRTIWSGGKFRQLRMDMLTGSVVKGSICSRCGNTCREWR